MLELLVAFAAIFVGVYFAFTGAKACSNGCWLNDLAEALLPERLEFLGGGLPWLALGSMLLVSAVARRIRP